MHNLIYLNDLAGTELDPYVRLNETQLSHAMKPGMFIAESPKVIERALRAGYRPASLLMEERALERDLADLDYEMAANNTQGLGQTPIYVISSALIRQLSGYNMLRGALAAMYRLKRPSLADFLATLPGGHPRVAVLERVVNHITELSRGKLYHYEANYSRYLELKEQRYEMAEASERKRQSILRHEREWIMRGCRARTTKSKERIARYENLLNQEEFYMKQE